MTTPNQPATFTAEQTQALMAAACAAKDHHIAVLRTALEWYADEARAFAKNSASANQYHALLASVAVLSLDNGRRADAALNHIPKGM